MLLMLVLKFYNLTQIRQKLSDFRRLKHLLGRLDFKFVIEIVFSIE